MPKPIDKIENIRLRQSKDRGHANHGWLDSYFTFSFADYFDEDHMGFRSLRVINEDRVKPAQGFGTHPHQNMEILTYVIEGALQHKDSMGHESVINAGDVQKITAGTGIMHSEFNASKAQDVHLLQIWILPDKKGLNPSYQQFTLPAPDATEPLTPIGSPEGGKNIIQFNQDVRVYRVILKAGKGTQYKFEKGRGGWLQMVSGKLDLHGLTLVSGDGAAIENEQQIHLACQANSEFLLFDLK